MDSIVKQNSQNKGRAGESADFDGLGWRQCNTRHRDLQTANEPIMDWKAKFEGMLEGMGRSRDCGGKGFGAFRGVPFVGAWMGLH